MSGSGALIRQRSAPFLVLKFYLRKLQSSSNETQKFSTPCYSVNEGRLPGLRDFIDRSKGASRKLISRCCAIERSLPTGQPANALRTKPYSSSFRYRVAIVKKKRKVQFSSTLINGDIAGGQTNFIYCACATAHRVSFFRVLNRVVYEWRFWNEIFTSCWKFEFANFIKHRISSNKKMYFSIIFV